jgi:hypothetical protein
LLGGFAQRGSSPANPVFVSGGGLGGGGSSVPGVGGAAGGIGAAATAGLVAGMIAVPLASIAYQVSNLRPESEQIGPRYQASKSGTIVIPGAPAAPRRTYGGAGEMNGPQSTSANTARRLQLAAAAVIAAQAALIKHQSQIQATKDAGSAINAGTRSTADKLRQTISAMKDADSSIRAGAIKTSSALRNLPAPITNITVKVSVTPGKINETHTIQTRYGPISGSHGSAALQKITG